MKAPALPERIKLVHVSTDSQPLGFIEKDSVHVYQPVRHDRHVSLTMTRPNLESYSSGSLHPIFSQNLPEGFNRRYIESKLARYARVDDMYLLALQGDHGIGRLSYDSELVLPPPQPMDIAELLASRSAKTLFPELLQRYYLRGSLSGVQPKVSVPVTNRTLEQRDIIVKTFDEEFDLLTVNEFVCMEAAAHCELEPPRTYLSDSLEFYVVERFDKAENGSLGFEDYTTLLRRDNTPDAKYTGTYEAVLSATAVYTASMVEVRRMYEQIAFNCLIGNGDMHLKNVALQYPSDMSRVFVSPPFDITHTKIYDTIDDDMALKIAGSKSFPDKAALLKLATGSRYHVDDAAEIVDRLAQGIGESLEVSAAASLFKGLRKSIESHRDQVMVPSAFTKAYRHDKRRKHGPSPIKSADLPQKEDKPDSGEDNSWRPPSR